MVEPRYQRIVAVGEASKSAIDMLIRWTKHIAKMSFIEI